MVISCAMKSNVSWPINFKFRYSWIFMAMKTDFHDPLISVLDHQQLFMAIKIDVFMSHEMVSMRPWKLKNAIFMALKKNHGFFISISCYFYEPTVGSASCLKIMSHVCHMVIYYSQNVRVFGITWPADTRVSSRPPSQIQK